MQSYQTSDLEKNSVSDHVQAPGACTLPLAAGALRDHCSSAEAEEQEQRDIPDAPDTRDLVAAAAERLMVVVVVLGKWHSVVVEELPCIADSGQETSLAVPGL